jgi:UDP-N-acetylglucosamine--N-acetylmuramyl-(pentapeptide) pyrophosphoryl-undecaprenol N-acetylglucosamine transferase
MSKNLVIMAAGTGGHIIPGLAVAAEMQRRGWLVSWLGTPAGMENQLVPKAGLPLDRIGFAGLRGKGALGMLRGAFQLLRAFGECFQILRGRQADAVLGMGGYVCFPGGLVAKWLKKPLVLVNADAGLLLSNKSLAGRADRIAFGFDGPAVKTLPNARVTGNPVRAEIEALPAPAERFAGRSGPLRVLVVGGSLGAQVLNEMLPRALALIPAGQRPIVTHQTGARHLETVKAAYAQAGVQADILPFIDHMAERLAACDLIVCRAGAITVSELCAAGVASLLVPLIVSTTSHQRDNAHWLAAHQAGLHLPQSELSAEKLADQLRALTRDDLLALATRARALARPQAAARVADEIEALTVQRKAAK